MGIKKGLKIVLLHLEFEFFARLKGSESAAII